MSQTNLLTSVVSNTAEWLVLLGLALAALLWMILDGVRRRLPASRWRLAATLPAVLLAPALILRLADTGDVRGILLEVAGGVIPAVVASAYAVRFRGLMGCPKGHPPYPRSKKKCPVCARLTVHDVPGYTASHPVAAQEVGQSGPARAKAHAWLATGKGDAFQLNLGETSIGRDVQSDIRLFDMTVSRVHAKIVVENNQFTIYDLGSTTGTWLNGNRVRHPEVLRPGDVIGLGETRLTFTTRKAQAK